MNDTPADVERRMAELFAHRSGSDRVRMACDMFDLARALMVAQITTENPVITPQDLRVQIFERTYGSDLDAADRVRRIARLKE